MPSDRRLACFLPDLAVGGVERVIATVLNGLAVKDWQVTLFTGEPHGAARAFLSELVEVRDLQRTRTRHMLLPLFRGLRTDRFDALLTAKEYANAVGIVAGLLARVDVVATVHSPPGASSAYGLRLAGRHQVRIVRSLYNRARVVAVSRGVARDIEQTLAVAAGSVCVIENPVVTPQLLAASASAPPHPWLTGGPEGRNTIVSVGRLDRDKDVATTLRALARTDDHVHLLIVGDGPERDALEQLTATLGLRARVEFVGQVLDPYPFIAHARCLVLSSRLEGLPTVLIEALALGCPVVSTDCETGPREVLDDGRFGTLVPVGDDEALAEAIEMTLRHPPAVPDDAWQRFRSDCVVERYDDLLRSPPRTR